MCQSMLLVLSLVYCSVYFNNVSCFYCLNIYLYIFLFYTLQYVVSQNQIT